jgi:RNA polymerase sigma-70 factor (ECF subfamily)
MSAALIDRPTPLPPSASTPAAASDAHIALERVCRERFTGIAETLAREFGARGAHAAEDALQEAVVRALRSWPERGTPRDPAAWLFRVARNCAIDLLRRERLLDSDASAARGDALLRALYPRDPISTAATIGVVRDPELRAMYWCCDPALSSSSGAALTLKVVSGFSVAEIARGLVRSEDAVNQQLARAKRKLRRAAAEVEPPDEGGLPRRLDAILGAIYLTFNEGYHTLGDDRLLREDLCREAIRLCETLLAIEITATPVVHALAALLELLAARFPARSDARGEIVLLDRQDRTRWDSRRIARGFAHLERAAHGSRLTPYHLEAEIAALHATAPTYAETDWRAILAAYDQLVALDRSPIVALNRAVALQQVAGPAAALRALESIRPATALRQYFFYHAVEGELRLAVGDRRGAIEAYRRALALCVAGPARRLIEGRLGRAR